VGEHEDDQGNVTGGRGGQVNRAGRSQRGAGKQQAGNKYKQGTQQRVHRRPHPLSDGRERRRACYQIRCHRVDQSMHFIDPCQTNGIMVPLERRAPVHIARIATVLTCHHMNNRSHYPCLLTVASSACWPPASSASSCCSSPPRTPPWSPPTASCSTPSEPTRKP